MAHQKRMGNAKGTIGIDVKESKNALLDALIVLVFISPIEVVHVGVYTSSRS